MKFGGYYDEISDKIVMRIGFIMLAVGIIATSIAFFVAK